MNQKESFNTGRNIQNIQADTIQNSAINQNVYEIRENIHELVRQIEEQINNLNEEDKQVCEPALRNLKEELQREKPRAEKIMKWIRAITPFVPLAAELLKMFSK